MNPVLDVPLRGRGGLLRTHDFRLFWLGETTSTFGSQMVVVAVPLVAIEVLHASTLIIGLLQACAWLPWLILGLPVGAWVDRLPKRPIMLICDAVSFLAFVSVAVAAWTGTLTTAQLVIAVLIGGGAQVFFSTAFNPYLRALLEERDRPEGNAKLETSAAAAQVAGPGLGGLAVQVFGAVSGLFINGLTFAYSAFCLARIRSAEPRREPSEGPRTSLGTEISEGVRFVVRDPYLRVMTLYEGVGNFGDAMMMSVAVVFLVRTVGVGAGVVGGLVAAMNVGGILGALAAVRLSRWLGTARATLLAVGLASPFTLLIPFSSRDGGLFFFIAGGAIYLAGVGVANVTIGTFLQTYVPEHLVGRSNAASTLVSRGSMPLGGLIGAILGQVYGPRIAILAAALVITVGVGALFIGPMRHRRDLPPALLETEEQT